MAFAIMQPVAPESNYTGLEYHGRGAESGSPCTDYQHSNFG